MPPSTHTLPNGDTFRLRDVVLIGGVHDHGTVSSWSVGLAGGCGMTIEGKAEELKAARDALAGALVASGWDKADALLSFTPFGASV